jgi:site-specific DNA-methyltransferase (adenine-specific)
MIERNHVYNADCMIGMAEMPDNYVDLCIVDPPYGIGNFSPNSGSKGTAVRGKEWDIKWNDSIPEHQYFNELNRVSIKRIVWGANYYNTFETGNGAIVWHKGKINPQFSQCEIASVSGQKKVDYYFQNWQGGGNWKGQNIHPCQKPVDLYKWLLHNYAKEGDLILDTHVGSGSSIIACIDKGFDYIGYEIDADYYKAMQDRIYYFTRQTGLFDGTA